MEIIGIGERVKGKGLREEGWVTGNGVTGGCGFSVPNLLNAVFLPLYPITLFH
jgi:hypothetical protein